MSAKHLVVGTLLFMSAVAPASAHRLDEYLEATTFALQRDYLQAQIRLTPGVAVFPAVMANIDTNSDGVISHAEQRAYAGRVLKDLALTLDGNALRLRLASFNFPGIEELKAGRGTIEVQFRADVHAGGPAHELIFKNRHESGIAAYLVNCQVPRDSDIRITDQKRDYKQSVYILNYVQGDFRHTGAR